MSFAHFLDVTALDFLTLPVLCPGFVDFIVMLSPLLWPFLIFPCITVAVGSSCQNQFVEPSSFTCAFTVYRLPQITTSIICTWQLMELLQQWELDSTVNEVCSGWAISGMEYCMASEKPAFNWCRIGLFKLHCTFKHIYQADPVCDGHYRILVCLSLTVVTVIVIGHL